MATPTPRRRRYPHLVRVRISERLRQLLEERARAQDCSLSEVARSLVEGQLRELRELHELRQAADPSAAIAALIAAEHARLLLESIIPEGRRLGPKLEAEAAQAAERRLEQTRAALESRP